MDRTRSYAIGSQFYVPNILSLWTSFLAAIILLLPGLAVAAAGSVPSGLPSRLLVGLGEAIDPSTPDWMGTSGVPWDARYRYFNMFTDSAGARHGWFDNWGFGPYDYSFATWYLNQCALDHVVPVIEFYQLNGEAPSGNEQQTLVKVQQAGTMFHYFTDFKNLMLKVKAFGQPVIVLIEADGFGFLEQQSGWNNGTYPPGGAYAAVRDSTVPELATLGNTLPDWGLAFLKLRQSTGATNAILALHVSAWATGVNVQMQPTADIAAQVQTAYGFLAPFGLTTQNAVGARYDALVTDPCDRDAGYYALNPGQGACTWDASDSAPTTTSSFNRYAAWLSQWNTQSTLRWILWQIPLGNSNNLNEANDPPTYTARKGYQDNRPEYFFSTFTPFGANDVAHLTKFANAGVFALLFGAGRSDQAAYQNDAYTDGQLFMKTRAGRFLANYSVSTGAPPPADTAQFNFEASTQGWVGNAGIVTGVAQSSTVAFAGAHSLGVQLAWTTSGVKNRVLIASPGTPAGAIVTFHVWVPAGQQLSAVQPYVMDFNWLWTGTWVAGTSLTANAWNTITVTVPGTAVLPLQELGVEFTSGATWSGTAYVDSVRW